MLGFSIQKLLILAAIIAAVWYGFKYIGRLDESRKADAKLREAQKTSNDKKERRSVEETEDMVQCPVCSAYVSAQAPGNCGRADCPY